jgi:hypothetical protein
MKPLANFHTALPKIEEAVTFRIAERIPQRPGKRERDERFITRTGPEESSFSGGKQGGTMQDLWMSLFTAVFFALAFSYVHACRKLR